MELDTEGQEWFCTTFEWKVKGLKALFESTKGESKSKVARSGKFDNGRWQILFYANSGLPRDPNCPDGYVSLYLSCDPTTEEREIGLADSSRHGWVRDGAYKFSFELRNLDGNMLYGSKEATNHSFSSRTANWGWAQFARRDTIYYNCPPIRSQDALLIICNVMSSPRTPPSVPIYPYLPAPKNLLDTVGSMLDDPLYSDVQFVFPRGDESIMRRIFASKKMLARAEYFATMFSSDFAEGSLSPSISSPPLLKPSTSSCSEGSLRVTDHFEDSDEEDEEEGFGCSSPQANRLTDEPTTSIRDGHQGDPNTSQEDENQSSPILNRSRPTSPNETSEVKNDPRGGVPSQKEPPGPHKTVVVVRDVAYRTYKAILYWLYTDHIVFAPLSSSFNRKGLKQRSYNEPSTSTGPATPAADASSNQSSGSGSKRPEQPASRAEWIKEWVKEFPGRPEPCSAKAVYRVADKIDIPDLKERAAQHIIKCLTVDNIAYEVFSPFSATFDDIRKVEITFFLSHWQDIRASECMADVWRQIRNGRHPGFEEVWPLIAQSLEFRPSTATAQPKYFDTFSPS